MREQAGMAVALRDAEEGVRTVDLSCGDCPQCAAGAELWCRDRQADGPDLLPVLTAEEAGRALAAFLAAAALLEAPADGPVLVADVESSALAVTAQGLCGDRPVVVGDSREDSVRRALATLDATGRAPVVVTTGDARRAVKAVRRGGYVCLPAAAGEAPTITELVQREVTLVGPRSLARVLTALQDDELAAALDAL